MTGTPYPARTMAGEASMRGKRAVVLLLSLALFGAGLFASPLRGFGDADMDEAAIRTIVSEEIVGGLLRRSPDLYLRSYAPLAVIFSYAKGAADLVQYREILESYFKIARPKSVDYEILYVRRDSDGKARVGVKFHEKGDRSDGTAYSEVFKRYFLLAKEQGAWRIQVDGYNEAHQAIERFHGKPKQSP